MIRFIKRLKHSNLTVFALAFLIAIAGPAHAEGWWQPHGVLRWDWQLQPPHDFTRSVDVMDLDLFDTDEAIIAQLKARGVRVICYINVGAWEDWRRDAASFPPALIGNDYDGWKGEKWLDISRLDLLKPLMEKRLDLCKSKGFDGVEPDNMDIYSEDTGFELTKQDQIRYNVWLSDQAHKRGLSIGQKNTSNLVAELLPHFDWALTEDCIADGWCTEMHPYIVAGKPVFVAEYTDNLGTLSQSCGLSKKDGYSPILKQRRLDQWLKVCP